MNDVAESEVMLGPVPKGWDVSVFSDEMSPDLEVQLTEVKRAGLSFFDLRSAFDKNVLDLTDAEVAAIKERSAAMGLRIKCIGSPINKHPFDPGHRGRELERIRRIGEIALALSAPYIRIFSPFLKGGVREPEYGEIRDWLMDQADYARSADLILLLENDGDAYGAFPANARRLMADLDGPHFKAVYDFSNSVLIGFPALPHWFPWIKPYLGGLHIKDSIFAKDDQGGDQIVPSGDGEGRIREVLADLIADGWQGPVSLEPHLWKYREAQGLDGVGQFRLSLSALNKTLDGLA